jgi:hypothetical protein
MRYLFLILAPTPDSAQLLSSASLSENAYDPGIDQGPDSASGNLPPACKMPSAASIMVTMTSIISMVITLERE